MRLSKNGINLIKTFEGLRLKAYPDQAGIWTIGYGSTKYSDGKAVKPGDIFENEAEALSLLSNTLSVYENAVENNMKVPLSQNQFDALVSITYNVGVGIMQNSTLCRKINAKDYTGAADQFLVWNKITDPQTHSKIVSDTLTRRRKIERDYFLKL